MTDNRKTKMKRAELLDRQLDAIRKLRGSWKDEDHPEMIIKKVTITKEQFNEFTEDERVLLILLGHMRNELVILHKLLIFAHTSFIKSTGIEKEIHGGQMLFIARLYSGKLSEGWQSLRSVFFGAKLSKTYESGLSDEGEKTLKELKKYFDKKNNIVDAIRNGYAFHNPTSDDIKKQLAAFEGGSLIFGGSYANTYYPFCDYIVNGAMFDAVQIDSKQNPIGAIREELTKVGKWFIDFTGHCMVAVLKKKFKQNDIALEEITLNDPPKIYEVTLPFFVNMQRQRP